MIWRYFHQDGGQIVEHCNVMLGAIDSYMLPFLIDLNMEKVKMQSKSIVSFQLPKESRSIISLII